MEKNIQLFFANNKWDLINSNKKVRKLLQSLNEELGEKADFLKFK